MLIITNHNRGGLIMKSVDFINKTLEIMLNRYGPFMTVHEYAEVMKLQPDTVYKQIADGTVDVGTIENPTLNTKGKSNRKAQKADILPKL